MEHQLHAGSQEGGLGEPRCDFLRGTGRSRRCAEASGVMVVWASFSLHHYFWCPPHPANAEPLGHQHWVGETAWKQTSEKRHVLRATCAPCPVSPGPEG